MITQKEEQQLVIRDLVRAARAYAHIKFFNIVQEDKQILLLCEVDARDIEKFYADRLLQQAEKLVRTDALVGIEEK
jgi:hypothetical protein